MRMSRLLPLLLAIAAAPLIAQESEPGALLGTIANNVYTSPTGAFRITVPVLPELGGRAVDTENVVTFQDNFNVLCSVAAFPMDATQRWEFSTRGAKDYLAYFFANFVMPDFQKSFPGARVDSAKFSPSVGGGGLFTYILLPGGSMFANRVMFRAPNAEPLVAKRGNLLVTKNDWVYVLSIELAERVTEHSTYNKTPEQEDDILRQRLIELFDKVQFTKPPPDKLDAP
ncbi:MAG TPA: hypothetical protein VG710_03195 [Opitutus sp.]|nr:hypothetical protein [Opitutus sp.]